MKADGIGEFFVTDELTCHDCAENGFDIDQGCDHCHGNLTVDHNIPIPWSTMKAIYKRMHGMRVAELEKIHG